MKADYAGPDERGHFGPYGGRFVAETLMEPLRQLEEAYNRLKRDPAFQAELDRDLKHYVGRPSPLYPAERLTQKWGGAQVLLKREDLNHTGAHKINNTVGQAVRSARPWAVDVSSGIEQAPGTKDAGKMRRFIEEVREADEGPNEG